MCAWPRQVSGDCTSAMNEVHRHYDGRKLTNMTEPAIGAAPRPKLLIVDDDHELCSMLAEYLGPEGFVTEAVGSGPAALERLGRDAVDLVVLDVMLPELSGFE